VAREKILHGATLLFDAVRVTLGPKSVLIQNSWGLPVVCNDSMTIAEPDLARVMDAVDQFDVSKESPLVAVRSSMTAPSRSWW
jgi:hypothetical protein